MNGCSDRIFDNEKVLEQREQNFSCLHSSLKGVGVIHQRLWENEYT